MESILWIEAMKNGSYHWDCMGFYGGKSILLRWDKWGDSYKDCGLPQPHGVKVCHKHFEGIPGTNIGKTSSFRLETENIWYGTVFIKIRSILVEASRIK